VVLGGAGFGFLLQSGWIPVVAPAIAFALSSATMVTYRAQQSQRQHQMVMTLLGQNTSKEIANALWENRDRLIESGKLPGQKLIATMLFTDIQGFSTISEQMPPEELLSWLNEYLEVMTEEVQNFQGIINKFTGDGLLAVFGVPVPRVDTKEIADDAQRAVACALAMGDRLTQLNPAWEQRGLTPVQMRVGIFTGEIVAGSLGGKNRLEYGVIGDSVNIASRLESCAKERQVDGCRILIAEETLTHLQGQFQVESWGAMALRGKQQTVEVYRVIGYGDQA
jgi:adenylate cyclase